MFGRQRDRPAPSYYSLWRVGTPDVGQPILKPESLDFDAEVASRANETTGHLPRPAIGDTAPERYVAGNVLGRTDINYRRLRQAGRSELEPIYSYFHSHHSSS